MDRDKLYSMEVEEQILGISIYETKCFIQVMELKVKESDFYLDKNKLLINAIKTVFREKQTTDFVILAEYLKKNNTFSTSFNLSGSIFNEVLKATFPSFCWVIKYTFNVILGFLANAILKAKPNRFIQIHLLFSFIKTILSQTIAPYQDLFLYILT